MAILGIDLAPKGDFAYAVWENGAVVETGISEERGLLQLFKKYTVRTLAVDNVGELVQHGRLIIKALGRLPYIVNVVEVTRDVERYTKVEELVARHFGIHKRLTPTDTAKYLAILAAGGVGTRVKMFEEETVILIHRKISTTSGGMSRNRFMRNISHRIKSLSLQVENKLREAKLDYDLFINEESGEITSARFIVYANREIVRRYVKPKRSLDVVVSIYSTPARRREVPTHRRYLIVGVDPGVVTGVAILTLEGEVLDTTAHRGFSRGDVLRYVSQWGMPVLVATDVREPPEFVKRLATMCGAVLYAPTRDLSSEEKAQLVEKSGWHVKTSHERDALAAAHRAYLEFKPKFEKIVKEFGNILEFSQVEQAKALVIRGYSIAHAVSEALKQTGERETKVVYVPIEKPCPPTSEEVYTRVKALEYENRQLEKELENLQREYLQLKRYVEEEKWRDLKYRELQNRIENLSKSLLEKENEIHNLKKAFVEILTEFGKRFVLVHLSELVECRGGEPVGVICRNLESIEDSIARGSLGVPLKLVTRLDLGQLYVVDMDLVRQLTREISRRLEDRDIDLKKILRQYRGFV